MLTNNWSLSYYIYVVLIVLYKQTRCSEYKQALGCKRYTLLV